MFSISNNGIIQLTAGDFFEAPLFINAGDNLTPLRYVLQEDDKLYFSIMEVDQPFECGIVRKIFTAENLNSDGDTIITLTTNDTENLLPGLYYYEVKSEIKRNNESYIETIVPRRKFIIGRY